MSDTTQALERVFQETSNFILIGLTGRTGSGCSTVARILSETPPFNLQSHGIYQSSNDQEKLHIVGQYIRENWKPFIRIEMRDIITGELLKLTFNSFKALISKTLHLEDNLISADLNIFMEQYEMARKAVTTFTAMSENKQEEI